MLMRCGRALIGAADVKTSVGGFDQWDYSAMSSHAGVHAVAVAAWLRAPSTDPVWVRMYVGSNLVSVYGLCMGTRMRGIRGELLNCLGALSFVIPCLSCPLFVYEQGITISVCVQIC